MTAPLLRSLLAELLGLLGELALRAAGFAGEVVGDALGVAGELIAGLLGLPGETDTLIVGAPGEARLPLQVLAAEQRGAEEGEVAHEDAAGGVPVGGVLRRVRGDDVGQHGRRRERRASTPEDSGREAKPTEDRRHAVEAHEALGVFGDVGRHLRGQRLLRERHEGLRDRFGAGDHGLRLTDGFHAVDDEEAGQHQAGGGSHEVHGLFLPAPGWACQRKRPTPA